LSSSRVEKRGKFRRLQMGSIKVGIVVIDRVVSADRVRGLCGTLYQRCETPCNCEAVDKKLARGPLLQALEHSLAGVIADE
jgi:hypothetical protein